MLPLQGGCTATAPSRCSCSQFLFHYVLWLVLSVLSCETYVNLVYSRQGLLCTKADQRAQQRVIKTAQTITEIQIQTLEDTYELHCLRRAVSITKDPTYPTSHLFDLMLSNRHYRDIYAHTRRFRNSFFPRAISQMNSSNYIYSFNSIKAALSIMSSLSDKRTFAF